jgi:hypothetical protein
MLPFGRYPFVAQALACWNWKCALLSATARSIVYLAAMSRSGPHGRLSIVLVEVAYVTLTSGLYAGLQQRALDIRPRLLGNLAVVAGVPLLAQVFDWLTHRAAGAVAPWSATVAVCVFAIVSALFHLHVMRSGAFLTGRRGLEFVEDFRRIPRLAASFVARPVVFVADLSARLVRIRNNEAAA